MQESKKQPLVLLFNPEEKENDTRQYLRVRVSKNN